jgi:hypothetical protein
VAVYQVECDAEGVWRVDVGWSREAQSYTVAIWDETGKDPSANDQGLIVGLGADGELPLLYDFLVHTTRYVDWTLPRNRAILAELKEAPWREEQVWHERMNQRRAERHADDLRQRERLGEAWRLVS